jgi:hypothetical protein
VPQVIGSAQACVFLELARRAARVVAGQILLPVLAQTGREQEGVGEDIQHGLSPFRLSMIAFAMNAAMMRLRKS